MPPLLLVLITSLLVRLPLYTSPYWRKQDTAEYIDFARNLAAGKGFTQSIKTTYEFLNPHTQYVTSLDGLDIFSP
jgi:hypothetical protein